MRSFFRVLISAILTFGASQAAAIDVNTSFSPTLLEPTQISRVRIEFLNNLESPATGLALSNALPDGVFIADPSNVAGTCGGTVSATNDADGGTLAITGGTIAGKTGDNATVCSFEADVFTTARGVYINTIQVGALSGLQSGQPITNAQEAEATLVAVLEDLGAALSLSIPGSIIQGGEVVQQILTLTNNNSVDLTGVALVHDFVQNVSDHLIASGPVTGTCGGQGTIDSVPARLPDLFRDTSVVSISGARIPANSTCEIRWNVTPARDPILEPLTTRRRVEIPAGSITSNEGATNPGRFADQIDTYGGVEVTKTFNGTNFATLNSNTASGANLSIQIETSNVLPISNYSLTDVLPDGLIVTSIIRNNCSALVAPNSDGTQIDFSFGSLDGAPSLVGGLQTSSCSIDARVVPSVSGNALYQNEIPAGTLGVEAFEFDGAFARLEVTDEIAAEEPLIVDKSFDRGSASAGDSTDLTFAFFNASEQVITNIDLLDDLDANVVPADLDVTIGNSGLVSTSCGGSVIAVPNTKQIRINDVSLAVGASCEVTVEVRLPSDSRPNITLVNTVPVDQVTFDLIGAPGQQILNRLLGSISILQPIQVAKKYSPQTVLPGGTSRLSLRFIRFTRMGSATDSIAIRDQLPEDHVVAPEPNILNECGGTVTAVPGTDLIQLSGGSLGPPPGSSGSVSCTVFVDIVAPSTPGSANNFIEAGDTTARDLGQPDGQNQMATVTGVVAPLFRSIVDMTVNKEFLTTTVAASQPSRVRITLANDRNGATDLTGVRLTDDFAGTNLRLADNANPVFTDTNGVPNSNGCDGGDFSLGRGAGGSITLSNARIEARGVCYFEFDVTSFQSGNFPNRINAGDVVTDQGATNAFNVVATLTVERELNVSKGFNPEVVEPGQSSQLNLSIVNATDGAFTGNSSGPTLVDTLPVGLTIDPSSLASTCSGVSLGVRQAGGGAQEVVINGGTFPANSSCVVTADLAASGVGVFTNTIPDGAIVTEEGGTNSFSTSATLRSVLPPTISKSFSPNIIRAGRNSRITFRLDNPNDASILPSGLTGASFSDPLTNMVIASPPNFGGTCSDVDITATAGGTNLTVSNIALAASSNCTVQMDVTSTVPGVHPNTTTGVTTNQTPTPGDPAPSVNLTVNPLQLVTLTKTFAEAVTTRNTPTRVTFELTNPNAVAVEIGPTGFIDVFPRNPPLQMRLANDPALVNTCLNTSVLDENDDPLSSGDLGIHVFGGEVPASGSCVISLNVTMNQLGSYTNTTSDFTTTAGVAPAASDTIEVQNNLPVVAASEGTRNVNTSDIDFIVDSVLGAGDLVAGNLATVGPGSAGNVDLSIISISPELSVDPDTGLIVVAGGTLPGTYTVVYEICEAGSPSNCAADNPTETVVVADSTIQATSDFTSAAPLVVAQADFLTEPGNVLGSEDTLNGGQATVAPGNAGNVILTIDSVVGPSGPTTTVSVNTNTGVISVEGVTNMLIGPFPIPVPTPPGQYTITYTICEDDNADNCSTATEVVEVRVTPITAAPEADRNLTGRDVGQSAGNVLGPGDTLDGVLATVGPLDEGSVNLYARATFPDETDASAFITIDRDTGEIFVAGGTPDGVYYIPYEISEEINRNNFANSSERIVITSTPIAAGAEPDRQVPEADAAIDAGSVLGDANDLLGGAPATPGPTGNVILSVVPGANTDPELSLNTATSNVTVAANTPAGTYTLEYQICEALNTDNCATAVETFVVATTPIAAAAEADRNVTASTSAAAAGNVLSVANDNLGGAAATPGSAGNVILTAVAGPNTAPELGLDTETGALTVAANTPSGTYTLEYEICERVNADNCASAIETVIVTTTPIAAGAEADRPVAASDSTVAAGNVLSAANDTLGSVAATPGSGGNVILTAVAGPNTASELSLDTDTGALTVAAGTPPGTYTLEYQICEAVNLGNCASAIETVVISDTPIAAAAEANRDLRATDAAQPAGNVLGEGDLLDGVAPVPGTGGTVVLTAVAGPNSSPELSLDPDTGALTVAAGTPPGTYTLEYQICEVGNANNCATAVETTVITATPISAASEAPRALFARPDTVSVGSALGSGDLIDGALARPGPSGNVVLSLVSADAPLLLSLNTGAIGVPGNTAAGTYSITYQICDPNDLDNCATATEQVIVSDRPVVAAAEADRPVTASDDPVPAGSVIGAGDQLDGAQATLGASGNVNLVLVTGADTDPQLSLDTDTGLLTVAAGTPPGTYTLQYEICERVVPRNCAAAIETVVVTATPIIATAEPVREFPASFDRISAGNALGPNDLLGGVRATVGSGGNVLIRWLGPNETLELDTNTAEITVVPNAPGGTHILTYEICDANDTDNCATATEVVSLTPMPLTAAAEADRAVTGSDDAIDAGSVFGPGDQLNMQPITTLSGGLIRLSEVDGPNTDPELSLNTGTGFMTLAAGAPAGTYTLEYQICRRTNANNCATAIETVVVTDTSIAAAAEPDRNVGQTTALVSAGNVLGGGDLLDGTTASLGQGGTVTLREISSDAPLTLDTATGLITVAANTSPGTYTVTYEICEIGNADNCAQATETVVVSITNIQALAEAVRAVNGTGATQTAGSVLDPANDLLDGAPAVPGLGGNVILTAVQGQNTSPELSLDPATGLITVQGGVPNGQYAIEYQICEAANPQNCATAIEMVEVTNAAIAAGPEADRLVTGSDSQIDVGSVLDPTNDTLSGAPATVGNGGNVQLTALQGPFTSPGLSLDPQTGTLIVAPGQAAGTYTLQYEICEAANLLNCAQAIETVVVADTAIAAGPEAARLLRVTNVAQSAGSVLSAANDTFNGAAAAPGASGNVVLTVVAGPNTTSGLTLDPETAALTLAANAPAGTYTLEYQICEPGNLDNCATAIETVVVTDTPIEAAAEADRALSGLDVAQSAGNVLGGQTDLLDGIAAVPGTGGTVVLTAVAGPNTSPELGLDTDTGALTVAAGTPAGTYTLEYQICEAVNLANCASAIETVVISDTPIEAGPEANRDLRATDAAQPAGNVLGEGDLLDGVAPVPGTGGTVVLTTVAGPNTSPELGLDTDTGALTVAAGTPPGTYTLEYQICEAVNLDNCASAIETVVVTDTPIAAAAEANRDLRATDAAQPAGNVLGEGDLLDGVAPVPGTGGTVVLTAVAGPNTSPELGLDPDTGALTVAAGTPPGTYTLEYQICEAANLANCATAIETVVTTDTPIAAAAEADRALRALDAAQPAGNVLDSTNDLLDSVPAVPGTGGTVVLSAVADPNTASELSLDPDTGALTVAAGTPPGTYTLEYQICEAVNLDNCASAIETVVVTDTPIAAAAEANRDLRATDAAQPAGNVLGEGDLLDGVAPVPGTGGTVVLTTVAGPNSSPELSLDPDTGALTVAAGTPPGTYTLEYQICEAVNLGNCASAIETVVITNTPIAATGVTFPSVNTLAGGETPSVLADDLLDGVTPTAGAGGTVVLTVVTPADDPGIILDTTSGVITIPPSTPPGTYTVTYQICEAVNLDNCATATETVTVVSIDAVAEDFPPFETDGGTTTSVLASDTVNGAPATLDNVTLTVVAADDGVTLDPTTGLITLAPGLPAAQYTVTYEICDIDAPTSCDQAVETVIQFPIVLIETTKMAELVDEGNGVDGIGDTVVYTITVENFSNTPVQNLAIEDTLEDLEGGVQSLDSGPTHVSSDQSSVEGRLLINETATYTATVVLTEAMVAAGGLSNSINANGIADTINLPDDIIGAPIPVADISDDGIDDDGNTTDDATITEVTLAPGDAEFTIVKTTPLSNVLRGSTVPYTLIVRNLSDTAPGVVDVVDLLPSGFFYVEGSGAVNGTPTAPQVNGRKVTFADVTVPPAAEVTVTLSAVITTGVLSGEHINFGDVLDPDTGQPLAPRASATVVITPEPVFDCGELIGKVYDDQNGDGYQNEGEPGLPNVRLASVDGVLITTDQFGRYSFPCASLPLISGSNFILKLDTRTLPSGYRLTTENPRVIRLTRGKVTEMNFGASITQLVRIDLNPSAFAPDDGPGVSPQLAAAIDGMLAQIADRPSMIRLSYHQVRDDDRVEIRRARRLMREVERYVRDRWRGVGNYKLTIEKLYVRDQ